MNSNSNVCPFDEMQILVKELKNILFTTTSQNNTDLSYSEEQLNPNSINQAK